MKHLPLGKPTNYTDIYTPALLCQIDREYARTAYPRPLIFHGLDIWNAYELSWLNKQGKPLVAVGTFYIPSKSRYTVESKSFKLYLNSFNQTHFENIQEVHDTLSSDLKVAVQQEVPLRLLTNEQPDFYHSQLVLQQPPHNLQSMSLNWEEAILLDRLSINIENYHQQDNILETDSARHVSETLVSHLLKTNCPVTGQPDWASVLIRYQGPALVHASILRYLVSFRRHQDFHEACVEKIFMDIWQQCKPEKLIVYARYTRRGGIDINPFRSSFELQLMNTFTPRQ